MFIRDPKHLTTEKQAELELICQRSETARKTYALTQQFMIMLRLRRGQEFETWLSAVEASHIAELCRFAHSLCKDSPRFVQLATFAFHTPDESASSCEEVPLLAIQRLRAMHEASHPSLEETSM